VLKCARRNDGTHGLRRVRADPKVVRKDRYLLSRFAAIEAEPIPVLDALTFENAVQVMERVGAACDGYARTYSSPEPRTIDLSVRLARGFEVLADGRLDEVLTGIYDGHLKQGGSAEDGLMDCYGWFHRWFSQIGGARFSPLLARALLEHAAPRLPIPKNAKLGELPESAVRRIALSTAAERAGMSKSTMRRIGMAIGSIRSEKRQGIRHSFAVEDVDRIMRDFKGALSLKEAMSILGTTLWPTINITKNESLTPALCIEGEKRREFFFRPQDIDGLLERLRRGARIVPTPPANCIALTDWRRSRAANVADRVRAVLDGRLRVRAVVKGKVGLHGLFIDLDELNDVVDGDQLTLNQASARMRLNTASLRKAIDAGLIKGVATGSQTLSTKAVARFAERFMMLSEIRDRLGGEFLNLRKRLTKAGFHPDPKLKTCRCAAYLRSELEPFVRKVEAGEVVMGKGEACRIALAREAKKILERAKSPVPTAVLIAKIRLKMPLGPSDDEKFFHTKLWYARAEIVSIQGAGWWLRARPYLGIQLPADGPVPVQRDIVHGFVLKQLERAQAPLAPESILADLRSHDVTVPSGDGEKFLQTCARRHQDKIIKLSGLGYWDRSRPYEPALYDPKIWKRKVQTAAQRTALWTMKFIEEAGRPLSSGELIPKLAARGLLPGMLSGAPRYMREAVAEFADEIVLLRAVGYWLATKPWPAAGYKPAGRQHAA
jgi:Fe2+ transport system protein FeoA